MPPIIDADCHIIEPFSLWQTHIDPAFADRAPRLMQRRFERTPDETLVERFQRLGPRALVPLPPEARFAGRSLLPAATESALITQAALAQRRMPDLIGLEDPGWWLARLDRRGVDACALFPTYVMTVMTMSDVEPALAEAVIDAYNRWLRDFCAADPTRLLGVGVLSLHRPETLADQVERLAEWGFRAVMLRPDPFAGRPLGHPAHAGLFAACARLDLGLALHCSVHSFSPIVGADRFTSYFARLACSHPMEAMMGFLSLLEGGVFESQPDLRVAFLESGAGWVPAWLARLDAGHALFGDELGARAPAPPSSYFRRSCVVGVEADEPGLQYIIESLGPERLMFGSDEPHLDHADGALEVLRPRLGSASDAILGGTAARFFGLPADGISSSR